MVSPSSHGGSYWFESSSAHLVTPASWRAYFFSQPCYPPRPPRLTHLLPRPNRCFLGRRKGPPGMRPPHVREWQRGSQRLHGGQGRVCRVSFFQSRPIDRPCQTV